MIDWRYGRVEFFQGSNLVIIAIGFLVWLLMAPRISSPKYGELFLAYMATLMFCLVGTTEIMMIKPIPFLFTLGGVLAFIYIIVRISVKITIRR